MMGFVKLSFYKIILIKLQMRYHITSILNIFYRKCKL